MLKISDLTYDWKLSDIDKVQKNKLKVFSFFAAPQNKVQGAEASKISKLNNSLGISSLLKNSLMSSQKAYFGFKLSLYSINWKALDNLINKEKIK
jgi:hypothetical protein